MCKSRDAVVRRAVARHIMQQVRHSRVAKRRRAHSTVPATAFTAWPGCASEPEPETQPKPEAVSATAAAITALAAAMSSARMENTSTDVLPVLDAETQLIERIVELQREKEYLLRIVQRIS
ncbi:hypothetical protein IW152_004584 [Coemansia sp. BCRC 34962]|nr:hypothetical protein IW152_004584 [Coemansia sp. BCRC 34962]